MLLVAKHTQLVARDLVLPLHVLPPDPFDMESDDEGAVDRDQLLAKVELARKNHPSNIPGTSMR
ncbi:hypothetical protein BT96DRAFT_995091 [Gymnopus androsaceus JB14]|uniref:Uncharacterized protein n=1 Tax=Gymnopus androsaceus JB14 TaxID=1447944 RepID=A0A6A4HM99_9AGAR|nr:hypothetical protein BT96DRAFT_995091 [Gymnopus androsaceus JB14]